MGLTLTAKYNGAPSYDMGYVTFGRLRMAIANEFSKELGRLYKNWYMCSNDGFQEKLAMAWLNDELKKRKYKSRAVEFLFMSDCGGKLSPYKCDALLDAILDMDNSKRYGYEGRAFGKVMTIKDFKALLHECYERRCYMEWY